MTEQNWTELEANWFPCWGRNARTSDSTQVTTDSLLAPEYFLSSTEMARALHDSHLHPCRELLVVVKGKKFPDGQGTLPNVSWRPGHVEAQCVIHPSSQHEMRMRIISC